MASIPSVGTPTINMNQQLKVLAARHIQNLSDAKTLEPHWGYVDRALPCTNDAGSCAYLDVVYHSHDLGMLYAGIIWATIGAILLIWAIGRRLSSRSGFISTSSKAYQAPQSRSSVERMRRSISSGSRRLLLPESIRTVFGCTTRLQVLILAILVVYLTIWSFAGIVYKTWITPVKNSTLHNTRTSLGPWADRIGILAYALIPLSVLLSSRESILSVLTGIPYQHFNFIHRWLGYIILAQSILHTIGWTIIETRLYQPQPKTAREWITQKYMVWGIVAQLLMVLMFIFSLRPVIKITGYEFFRKVHYIIAMLFIGACWGHWQQLKCFLLPSLLIWFLDRAIRLIRTSLIHYNYLPDGSMGFTNAKAQITRFRDDQNGDVVRLDFTHPHGAWDVGQHFYLCFPQLSIWQSHPFTPSSLPNPLSGTQQHSYIIRAKSGETKKLASLAATSTSLTTAPVVLTGPYGEQTLSSLDINTNVLCIAGGTGITYVLPVLLHLASIPSSINRSIALVWAVRKHDNTNWIAQELAILQAASKSHNIQFHIFVTQEDTITLTPSTQHSSTSLPSPQDTEKAPNSTIISLTSSNSIFSKERAFHRPNLHASVTNFTASTVTGPTTVFASGPGAMISELRTIVASCNRPGRVWRGDEKHDVSLICDDRIEW